MGDAGRAAAFSGAFRIAGEVHGRADGDVGVSDAPLDTCEAAPAPSVLPGGLQSPSDLGAIVAEKKVLSPNDVALMWGVNRHTAKATLEAMDKELGGRLLLRGKSKRRQHVRVLREKLASYMALRSQEVPSETLRLIRSLRCRIRELEELVTKEIGRRMAE